MPEISRFFGIVIQMFYDDYVPPHFHAVYAEHTVTSAIETLRCVAGCRGTPLPWLWNGLRSNRTSCWLIGIWRGRNVR